MPGKLQPSLFDWTPSDPQDRRLEIAVADPAEGTSNPAGFDPAIDPAIARDPATAGSCRPRNLTAQNPPVPPSECGLRGAECGSEGLETAGSAAGSEGPHRWTPQSVPAGAGDCGVALRTPGDHQEAGAAAEGEIPRPARGVETGSGERAVQLRPYQLAAIAAVERRWEAGDRRTLLVLPTGTGKTVCFAELARRCVAGGKRALVVAHRTELLEQAQRKLSDAGVRAAIEQARQRAGRAPVVVGSVQSLRGDRLAALLAGEFGLVVIDEAHHATAASYRAIVEHFPDARIVGVTATADRADGVGLRAIFASVAFRYEMRDAIRDGWLVPVLAKRVHVAGLDLRSVRAHHGDLDQRELAEIMQREQALHGVVAPLLELAGDRRTIAFAVDVAHAHAIAALANRYRPGIARAVDGSASDDDRRAALVAFRRGDYRLLVNCALYTEGFDEPTVSCIALCRPTQSRVLYTQMVGRGTRLAPGKRDVLVLDFVGNAGRHKLVGPADALAGLDLPDEVRADVEAALDGGQIELEDVLAHAEAEAEQRRDRVRLIAIAHYRATEIDPFFGSLPPDPEGAWAKEPATATQIKALTSAGFSRLPDCLTRGEASRYIAALQERRKLGLASLKQCRRLHSLGIETKNLTALRAAQLYAKLRQKGFRPWVLRDEPEFRRSSK